MALFPAQVCAFIEATQPKLWGDMRSLHGSELEASLIAALVKKLDAKGSLRRDKRPDLRPHRAL